LRIISFVTAHLSEGRLNEIYERLRPTSILSEPVLRQVALVRALEQTDDPEAEHYLMQIYRCNDIHAAVRLEASESYGWMVARKTAANLTRLVKDNLVAPPIVRSASKFLNTALRTPAIRV